MHESLRNCLLLVGKRWLNSGEVGIIGLVYEIQSWRKINKKIWASRSTSLCEIIITKYSGRYAGWGCE